jgi:Predicted membrane protein (DUF2207)
VSQFNSFVTGYEPALLALVFVLAYFILAALVLSISGPAPVQVTRYEPPKGASPAVAAWLFDRGDLPRAVAAAAVNMAAKGYVKIQQDGDLYSLVQLGPDVSLNLEPEEDALARTLFKGYDCFDFDEATMQLRDALEAFHTALKNTMYFSERIFVSVPAWVVSALGTFFALERGHYWRRGDEKLLGALLFVTFGCFIISIRTIPATLEKIASRLPGSTVRQRPWSDGDSKCFTFIVTTFGGLILIALLSTHVAALLTACFMAVNAVFYHRLQGPTAKGQKIIADLTEYRKFLAEVEADKISRTKSCDTPPVDLNQKDAYALAFHLDLGWGEQFVTTIANLVEYAEVFGRTMREEAS